MVASGSQMTGTLDVHLWNGLCTRVANLVYIRVGQFTPVRSLVSVQT